MRVHQTDSIQAGLVSAASAPEPKQTERSFGATLAETSRKSPKGEVTQKVDGHDYIEVVAGPRNGMFINKSGNDRDGQAFVRKRGAEFDLHIYGKGADREIVKVPHKDAKPEQIKPVDGRPYAEITSGSRDGMFVNKTSNERSGEAFVLVKRADRDLHIYGSGKDRRVIVSWHKDHEADKPEAAKQEPKAETGGISAP